MIPAEHPWIREDVDRFIGRLPRHIAYPLILLFSVVLWSLVGIAAVRVATWFAS
jgi:hypothetical protein